MSAPAAAAPARGRPRALEWGVAWLLPVSAAVALGGVSHRPLALAVLALSAGWAIVALMRRVGGAGVWLLGLTASVLLGELASVGAGGQSGRILWPDLVLVAGLTIAVVRSRGEMAIPRAPFLAAMAPFLAWAAASALVAADPLTALAELKEWAVAGLAGAAAAAWASDARRARLLLGGVAATGALLGLAMAWVAFHHPAGIVIAVMLKLVDLPWGRSNYLAGFLILSLPLALGLWGGARRLGPRLGWTVVIAACALGLALAASKGAMVSLLLMAPVALIGAGREGRGMRIGLFAVLGVTAGLFVTGPLRQVLDYRLGVAALDYSMSERVALYRLAWGSFLRHPLTGLGINNFSVASNPLHGLDTVPHNLELGFLAELGAPGLVLALVWVGTLLLTAWRLHGLAPGPAERALALGVRTAWLGFAAHNQVESTLYGGQFKVVLMVAAAATWALGAAWGARAERSS